MLKYFNDTRYRRERIFLVVGLPLLVLFLAGIFVLLFFPRQPPLSESPLNQSPPSSRGLEKNPAPMPRSNAVAQETSSFEKPAPRTPVPAPGQGGTSHHTETPSLQPATDDERISTAVQAFEAGDLAMAQTLIDQIDLAGTRSSSAWLLAGVLKEKSGDASSAMEIYSRGIDSAPSANLYYRRAVLSRNSGELEAALRDLEKVTTGDSEDVLASNERFLLLLQMEKNEQFLAELREMSRDDRSPRESACVFGLCGLALENGQYPEAAKLLARAKILLRPEIFEQLLSNPVITRHQSHPSVLPFFIKNFPEADSPSS